jgi:hypothetical protein
MMSHHLLGGDMTTDTKAVARWDTQEVPEGMEHIRCAKYPDLLEYHHGVGGKGAHAYSWEDKPHRLVYDLTGMAADYRDEIDTLRSALAAKSKDAARYAWLRDPDRDVSLVLDKVTGYVEYHEGTQTGGYSTYEYRAGEELDSAIDAAMEKSNEHQDQ